MNFYTEEINLHICLCYAKTIITRLLLVCIKFHYLITYKKHKRLTYPSPSLLYKIYIGVIVFLGGGSGYITGGV